MESQLCYHVRWLWKWRNEYFFSNITRPLEEKVRWLQTQIEETIRAFKMDVMDTVGGSLYRDVSVGWV